MSKELNNVDVVEVSEVAILEECGLEEIFGDKSYLPIIKMFDKSKNLSVAETVNLSTGENLSISDIINEEVKLLGMGAVLLDYVDQETGEFGDYTRYILITDKGAFTTASSFIGRTLKIISALEKRGEMDEFKVKFKQVEKDGKRRYYMNLV